MHRIRDCYKLTRWVVESSHFLIMWVCVYVFHAQHDNLGQDWLQSPPATIKDAAISLLKTRIEHIFSELSSDRGRSHLYPITCQSVLCICNTRTVAQANSPNMLSCGLNAALAISKVFTVSEQATHLALVNYRWTSPSPSSTCLVWRR